MSLPEKFGSKVVGGSFTPDYPDSYLGIHDGFENEDVRYPAIELRRNPHNQIDGNAIEVRISESDLLLGHLPKDLAARLAPLMDDGERWEADISSVDVHPDHRDRPGLSISIRRN